MLLLVTATLAGAAPAQRYDLAYTWDTDIGRTLKYRKTLAAPLALSSDGQLKVVGRGQEYGVISPLNGTLAQAQRMAEQQTRKLRRVGLKTVQPIKADGYHSLYHVQYARGARPESLAQAHAVVRKSLGSQLGSRLVIEQVDGRTHALIYRCWASKAAALRIAKQHQTRLKGKKISPAIISAVERPSALGTPVIAGPTDSAHDRKKQQLDQLVASLQNSSAQPPPEGLAKIAQPPGGKSGKGQRAAQEQVVPAKATTGLNTQISAFLREQQAKGRLRKQERAGLVAYDLANNTYMASFNAQRPFQAASMIKPFVALAFFHQVDKGKMRYTPQHRHMMEAMIQQSSNEATNWFIRQLGGPARCQALLKKEYGGLLKQVRISEYIPPGGKTYRNSAPPSDYIQFLRALWHEQLPRSKEMLRVMSLPGRDRIFCGTDLPSGTQVYNKTGTTALLCGDMGILVPRNRNGQKIPYAIVGIVERSSKPADYKQWMTSGGGVIRDFSSLVYEEMKRKYNLL